MTSGPNPPKTGRSLAEVAGKPPAPVDPAKCKDARKAALPRFVEPALASLTARPPAGARWLHEIKFDGYRIQARIENGRVALMTRSGHDWTEKFGEGVTKALRALPVKTALLDGELVVESAGVSDFSALQSDLSEGRDDRFLLYLFDALHLDGYDLRDAPLLQRKSLLENLLAGGADDGPLRFSQHLDEEGDVILRHVCRLGLEGIVSKLREAPYRSGRAKAGANPNARRGRNSSSAAMSSRRRRAARSVRWRSAFTAPPASGDALCQLGGGLILRADLTSSAMSTMRPYGRLSPKSLPTRRHIGIPSTHHAPVERDDEVTLVDRAQPMLAACRRQAQGIGRWTP